jgi:hypothetical protein
MQNVLSAEAGLLVAALLGVVVSGVSLARRARRTRRVTN